jgi:hypothetical protein
MSYRPRALNLISTKEKTQTHSSLFTVRPHTRLDLNRVSLKPLNNNQMRGEQNQLIPKQLSSKDHSPDTNLTEEFEVFVGKKLVN